MLRNGKTICRKHSLVKRKHSKGFFHAKLPVYNFFLLFSEKTRKMFRYYKNRTYICCEMKPKLFW